MCCVYLIDLKICQQPAVLTACRYYSLLLPGGTSAPYILDGYDLLPALWMILAAVLYACMHNLLSKTFSFVSCITDIRIEGESNVHIAVIAYNQKIIVILGKDVLRKYKMQFLKDDLIYYGKKPTHPTRLFVKPDDDCN